MQNAVLISCFISKAGDINCQPLRKSCVKKPECKTSFPPVTLPAHHTSILLSFNFNNMIGKKSIKWTRNARLATEELVLCTIKLFKFEVPQSVLVFEAKMESLINM